jgi:hypothetical protein
MTSPVTAYNLWDSRTSLGAMRDTRPEPRPFSRFFTSGLRSTDEWIDFEKLPIKSRRLAPFVKPMGQGRGIYTDKAKGMRFKPANVVIDEAVDPKRPLTYQPGIDQSMFDPNKLSPMQRLELIKVAMTVDAMDAVERRWEWMRAKALIDGKVTCNYEDGDSVLVDFQRDAGHTEVLTAGNRFGDAGVSVYDKFQAIVDTMNDAEFGGQPVQVEMGGGVWGVIRKDQEIKDNLDKFRPVGGLTIERGVVTSGDRSKRYKVGELQIGGGSGQVIELFVNNEAYEADDGTQVRYVGNNEMVFLSTPETINGFECFGMIQDRDAEYQALPIFPKNYLKGDRVKVEHLSFESAPIMVPINPNGTYKLTPIA